MFQRMAVKSSLVSLILLIAGCDGGSGSGSGSGQHSPVSPSKRKDNFKTIALALHDFHDAYRSFPPAQDANSGLSWRVQVLPYIGHEDLYAKFHQDEPWDSEHNKSLLSEMPKEFKTLKDETKTTIMAFVTIDESQPPTVMTPLESGTGSRISDIKDGSSNTVFFVEAAPELAVPWTKPADLDYDANKPIPKLGWPGDTSVLVALSDTSVVSLPKDAQESLWRAIITRAGGEPTSIGEMIR